MTLNTRKQKHIVCLTPAYNDWESFQLLVEGIKNEFATKAADYFIQIVVVDDGSTDSIEFSALPDDITVDIVTLKKNLGHQRAIATGLQFIHSEKIDYDFVIVLDSDGEDRPQDILKLVSKCEELSERKIVFAQRKKRQEPILFRTGYLIYKQIFKLFTGTQINFGNFSCIPHQLLKKVVLQENLWNHYSGSIIQSRIPFDKVLIDRGKRYAGNSKMNFTNLVLHGLSSVSVYFDSLCVRILKFSLFGVLACLLGVVIVLYFRFFTTSSVPGWASSLILLMFSIILQLSSVTLIVLLMQLSSRKDVKAPSASTYKSFVDSVISTKKINS
jgi:glycosyltransferase involved in cell wall biosynthesis